MDILEMYGIDPFYLAAGIAAFLLLLIIVLFIILIATNKKLKKLKRNYEAFMQGENGKSLESYFLKRFEEIDGLKAADLKHEEEIHKIVENMKLTYQKLGVVKYNAFSEMGGKLSFAIAMLNQKNDGFILNAMHSSDGCYTYAKEVVNGESFIVLGEEEKQALDMALQADLMKK